MYSFLLKLTKTDAALILQKDGEGVATKTWAESRDMGKQLFEALQVLLQENSLGPTDVDSFRLETEVSDNFTSVKIAETVAQVYNWSVSVQAKDKLKKV